jgi:hypothetical protein
LSAQKLEKDNRAATILFTWDKNGKLTNLAVFPIPSSAGNEMLSILGERAATP